ncbi:stage II sporulation protein D [Fervidibacillus halotolerans]|uniref:Stage II sporulation protein D n=1 Tax=Fervidibacillus halotolerans TaxID=2980027 RepID=A0A9E8M0N7_9BACI|nr:stage II sporulation protein D [Fervidibacillus halotolerans]WAA12159.1 stage II sporulation protein D [Fervidibacillus halotolerans]
MKRLKLFILAGVVFVIATIFIPSILVLPFSTDKVSGRLMEVSEQDWDTRLSEASAVEVSVYRSRLDKVEQLPIEQYVVGVVASEMPANFEEEALKAQSLAARTYIIKQLVNDHKVALLKGADVDDTQAHQVYKSIEELKKQWGTDYFTNIEKIRQAVYETKDEIIVYDNAPIHVSYFSTSNGFTENAEDYWKTAFPYLKSVESPWDIQSPKFNDTKVIQVSEFEKKLNIQITDEQIGEIIALTEGKRVAKVKIGKKEFTGREIREKLGLNSTDFTWERKGDEIVIQTKGYGHGVGMSQYGANGMAKEGKTYTEILKYYYEGVEITDVHPFIEKAVVKK